VVSVDFVNFAKWIPADAVVIADIGVSPISWLDVLEPPSSVLAFVVSIAVAVPYVVRDKRLVVVPHLADLEELLGVSPPVLVA